MNKLTILTLIVCAAALYWPPNTSASEGVIDGPDEFEGGFDESSAAAAAAASSTAGGGGPFGGRGRNGASSASAAGAASGSINETPVISRPSKLAPLSPGNLNNGPGSTLVSAGRGSNGGFLNNVLAPSAAASSASAASSSSSGGGGLFGGLLGGGGSAAGAGAGSASVGGSSASSAVASSSSGGDDGIFGLFSVSDFFKVLFSPFEFIKTIAGYFKLPFDGLLELCGKALVFGIEAMLQPFLIVVKIVEKIFVPDQCRLRFMCKLGRNFEFIRSQALLFSTNFLESSLHIKAFSEGVVGRDCDLTFANCEPRLKESVYNIKSSYSSKPSYFARELGQVAGINGTTPTVQMRTATTQSAAQ